MLWVGFIVIWDYCVCVLEYDVNCGIKLELVDGIIRCGIGIISIVVYVIVLLVIVIRW